MPKDLAWIHLNESVGDLSLLSRLSFKDMLLWTSSLPTHLDIDNEKCLFFFTEIPLRVFDSVNKTFSIVNLNRNKPLDQSLQLSF